MAEFLGSSGPIVVTVMGTGTTATPLTGVREARLRQRSAQNRVDVTVAGDTAMQYLDDLPESAQAVLTVSGLMQDATNDVLYALDPGDQDLTVVVALQGTGTNKPKSTGTNCTITNKETGAGFRDGQPYTLEFTQNTGPFTEGTF